jgi:endonuclease G
MKKLLAVLLFVPLSVLAQIAQQCPQFLPNGPVAYQAQPGDQELCKTNYAVIHKCSVKAPAAVFEHITPQAISGPAKRQDDFRPDSEVHEQCRATLSDYAGNLYDRGHMSAAGNNTQTREIMSESFFLSNMVPQTPNNNRGIWRILEMQIRDQVKESGQSLYVVSGGIYDPGHLKIGNGVGVPTRLYKIIINKQTGRVTAFLMPNSALPVADLLKYQTTVEEVETATGMKFKVKQ